jgi:hypothetical protein
MFSSVSKFHYSMIDNPFHACIAEKILFFLIYFSIYSFSVSKISLCTSIQKIHVLYNLEVNQYSTIINRYFICPILHCSSFKSHHKLPIGNYKQSKRLAIIRISWHHWRSPRFNFHFKIHDILTSIFNYRIDYSIQW